MDRRCPCRGCRLCIHPVQSLELDLLWRLSDGALQERSGAAYLQLCSCPRRPWLMIRLPPSLHPLCAAFVAVLVAYAGFAGARRNAEDPIQIVRIADS